MCLALVVSVKPGESPRLEARRLALLAQEEAVVFAPERNPTDLAVLRQSVEAKQP